MNPKKIYGHWIKWHGGECPVPPDTMVEMKFRRGAPEREERARSAAQAPHLSGGSWPPATVRHGSTAPIFRSRSKSGRNRITVMHNL